MFPIDPLEELVSLDLFTVVFPATKPRQGILGQEAGQEITGGACEEGWETELEKQEKQSITANSSP